MVEQMMSNQEQQSAQAALPCLLINMRQQPAWLRDARGCISTPDDKDGSVPTRVVADAATGDGGPGDGGNDGDEKDKKKKKKKVTGFFSLHPPHPHHLQRQMSRFHESY